jgi:alkylated DNA repair dioxygenase AlkB
MRQQSFKFAPAEPRPPLPEGMIFVPEFLTGEEEQRLLAEAAAISFKRILMRGVEARRRVAHYGMSYSFTGGGLGPAPELPRELEPLRARVAAVAGIAPERFAEAMVTEYSRGAGIGWHRDAPPFGIVAGVSLGAACRMRLRKRENHRHVLTAPLPARSLYVLRGESRAEWEHMIPPVKEVRYSITFRTLRREG